MDYIKLSSLVGQTFRVEKIEGFTYKKWDGDVKKMLTSNTPQKGFRKVWKVVTDRGTIDMGMGQIGTMAEACMKSNGDVNLIGQQFNLGSNGKTGMEIRYYFNVAKEEPVAVSEENPFNEEPPF